MQIQLDRIYPNPEQPRRTFDPDELEALAQSIRTQGVIQPVSVEASGEDYILHDGERRWRACRMAGLSTIPAVVIPPLNGTGSRDRLVRALVANVQRSDLNPIEIALTLRRLKSEHAWSHKKLAEETGIPLAAVPKFLRLLDLDEELQDLVAHGELPRDDRVVRALLSIEQTEVRLKFARRMARPGVTINAIVRGAERLNERLVEAQAPLPVTNRGPARSAPSLRLVDKLPHSSNKVAWNAVRAVAKATCDDCDVQPDTPEPAWSLITEAADATCKACSVGSLGVMDICRQCPAVELLRRMAGVGK